MGTKSTTNIDRTVGVRIKTLRKAKGLTQGQLAAAAGITLQQVQKYERGANRIGASRLQGMAHALEVPIPVLFGEAEGTGQDDVLVLLSDQNAIDLLKVYAVIEDEQLRRDVLAIVCNAVRIGAVPYSGSA